MQITRQFTRAGSSPFADIPFKAVDIEICHADETQRLCIPEFEVPANWSYAASEYLARHFLRKTGVPAKCLPNPSDDERDIMPEWLWPSVPNEAALNYLPEAERYGSEYSAAQIFHRLAGAWTYWGWRCDYFDTEADARAFYDECCYAMAQQMMAPAAPQWLNTGLHWAYGIDGPAQGHYHIEPQSGRICKSTSAYARPQHHHCFIQSVRDELVGDGGIMDLWEREARLFKYGSGTGSNMSSIRSAQETLSSGANSGGLIRFLSIGDKAAGAIKPGGGASQVEKLVLVDIDHPEIESFVRWKTTEEYKAAALVAGARQLHGHLKALLAALESGEQAAIAEAELAAREAQVPESHIARVKDYAAQGFSEISLPVFDCEADSEVFLTVGAHQARMAVRVPDHFLHAVSKRGVWPLYGRRDGIAVGELAAEELIGQIAQAGWATGEPAVQFSDTIKAWHGCAKEGPITASSPRGEFLFLDDTACDIATLNLVHFVDETGEFDVASFEHLTRLLVVMLDIAITMAQYPSREIARNTYRFRPVGLSYCNLGAMLMQMGYAYDSEEGRAMSAGVTALMTGAGYAASAELARELGAFEAYSANRDGIMRLMWQHHEAAFGRTQYLGSVDVCPPALDHASLPDAGLSEAVQRVWDLAMIRGDEYGYSNAQISLMAASPRLLPLLDAGAAGVAPLAQLVEMRPHPRGGVERQLNGAVIAGLQRLGYDAGQIQDIIVHVCGHGTLAGAPAIGHEALAARGFKDEQLVAIDVALMRAAHLRHAFDSFVLGERFCRDVLQMNDAQLHDAGFDVLRHIGFSTDEIARANAYACGTNSLEDAPHISEEDLAVFSGELSVEAQLNMMASVQSFVSGGIAYAVPLARDASIEQCRNWLVMAWRLGLKSLSLQRAGGGLYDTPPAATEATPQAAQTQLAHAPQTTAGHTMPEGVRWSVRQPSIAVAAVDHLSLPQATGATAREPLPARRHGFTQKAAVGNHTLFLRTGEYPDGRLGEIFIDMPRQSPAMRSMMNQFAIAISIALQHGVPLQAFVDGFRMSQFEPSGHVEGSHHIETATSVLDYIFRELSAHYGQPPMHRREAEATAREASPNASPNATQALRDIMRLDG